MLYEFTALVYASRQFMHKCKKLTDKLEKDPHIKSGSCPVKQLYCLTLSRSIHGLFPLKGSMLVVDAGGIQAQASLYIDGKTSLNSSCSVFDIYCISSKH